MIGMCLFWVENRPAAGTIVDARCHILTGVPGFSDRLGLGTVSCSCGCARRNLALACVCIIPRIHTMRTNIVIDDKLMKDTLRVTGLRTKREAVEQGLRTLLRLRQQEKIRGLRGKLNWQGDLDKMRTDK